VFLICVALLTSGAERLRMCISHLCAFFGETFVPILTTLRLKGILKVLAYYNSSGRQCASFLGGT
jgi:hypothetical protein